MKSEVEEKENVLLKLKKSRKAFLPEYFCAAFLLLVLIFSYLTHFNLNKNITSLFIAISVFSIALAEISRLSTRYTITETKIVIVHGFIKQSKKNIYFHSLANVPDINTIQTHWQRIVDYGKILFHAGGGLGESFELNEINNPKKVLITIEKLITKALAEKYRH